MKREQFFEAAERENASKESGEPYAYILCTTYFVQPEKGNKDIYELYMKIEIFT